ncbi:MAG: hypothetical protein Q9227_005643 [Pyrenula ochraceoflavens]
MAPIPLSDLPSQLFHIAVSISSSIKDHDLLPPTHTSNPLYPNLQPSARQQNPSSNLMKIVKRQDILAIPTTYDNLNSGPAPGTVAGIVLGSVGGFLLILYLVYTIFTLGAGGRFRRSETVVEEEVIRRRSRSPRRSVTRSEVLEVHRSRSPPPRRESRRQSTRERETVEVRETISRNRSQSRVSPSAGGSDDIVEVFEEHSPVRQNTKPRRPSGGFRTVDPTEFGGGSGPRRTVRR